MRWFQNLTTGAKLHLGFGLVMLFLAATAWIANSEIGKLQAAAETLHERDFALALQMSEIRADLARERVDSLGLKGIPAGPARARLVEEIRNYSSNFDVRLQRVSALAAFDSEVAGRLADMKRAFTEYRRNRDADLAMMEQSKAAVLHDDAANFRAGSSSSSLR